MVNVRKQYSFIPCWMERDDFQLSVTFIISLDFNAGIKWIWRWFLPRKSVEQVPSATLMVSCLWRQLNVHNNWFFCVKTILTYLTLPKARRNILWLSLTCNNTLEKVPVKYWWSFSFFRRWPWLIYMTSRSEPTPFLMNVIDLMFLQK